MREPAAPRVAAEGGGQATAAARCGDVTPHRPPPGAGPARAVGMAGGAPLPAAVRRQMEPRFGANFGNVRVHTGDAAAQQSAALNANAFTVGQHIFFGADKFQPQSAGGQELIAHELTHTIQQGAAVQRDVVHRSAAVEVTQHVDRRCSVDLRHPESARVLRRQGRRRFPASRC